MIEDEKGEWVKWEDLKEIQQINVILYKQWIQLINNIEKEFEDDGWCRLVITKEKLKEMKNFMDRFKLYADNADCTAKK